MAEDPKGRGEGWEARPGHARLVRVAVVVVPVLAGVAAGIAVSRSIQPKTAGDVVLLWVVAFITSSVVLFGLAYQARRLLPLAALLELSLSFPDRTPSRVGVALRAGNLRVGEHRFRALQHARTGTRTEAVEAVLALAAALSDHDRGTRGHSERVRAYTELLGEELHLSTHDRVRLRWASLLHDVGKMAVPAETLNKHGALDDAEWEIIKLHPVHGAQLVGSMQQWLGEWGAVVEQHHERWDGTGYPHGLAGTKIHRGARMVAVADAFEVMTAVRAYKKPLPNAEARRRLAESAGTQFDPGMVRAFLNIGLGRLRLVTGPLAWLAQVPFLRRLDLAARAPAQMALGSVVAAAAVTAAVLSLPPPAPEAPVQLAGPARPGPQSHIIIDLSRSAPVPETPPAPLPPLAAADPPAVPALTPPPPEAAPTTSPLPPPQPAPTPLAQVVTEVAEPVSLGLAVGVGDGSCTGVETGGTAVGCPPSSDEAPPNADVALLGQKVL
jgi:putative nucleotidyltransferase with HDIG domain